jgi:DNA invertase Pin-like site-specific DNA recombinase
MPAKPARPVRVAIYSRVSTDHQTTENQERELRAIADRMGWTVVNVYRDQGSVGPSRDRTGLRSTRSARTPAAASST